MLTHGGVQIGRRETCLKKKSGQQIVTLSFTPRPSHSLAAHDKLLHNITTKGNNDIICLTDHCNNSREQQLQSYFWCTFALQKVCLHLMLFLQMFTYNFFNLFFL